MHDIQLRISDFDAPVAAKLVLISGSIDARSVGPFQQDLETRFIRAGIKRLVLEMSGVNYVNSTGLGYLVRLADQLRDMGGVLLLVAVPPAVRSLFAMLGMEVLFDIVPDLDAARVRLSEVGGQSGINPAIGDDVDDVADVALDLPVSGTEKLASEKGSGSVGRSLRDVSDGSALGSRAAAPDDGADAGGSAVSDRFASDEFTAAGAAAAGEAPPPAPAPPPPPPPAAGAASPKPGMATPPPAQQQQQQQPQPTTRSAAGGAPGGGTRGPVFGAPPAEPEPEPDVAAADEMDDTPVEAEEAAATEGSRDPNADSFDQLDAPAAFLELERRQRTERMEAAPSKDAAPDREKESAKAGKKKLASASSRELAAEPTRIDRARPKRKASTSQDLATFQATFGKSDSSRGAAIPADAADEAAAPAPVVAAAAAVAVAPAVEMETLSDGATIERRTTVRYYEQMNPLRNFPLLVLLTKEKVEKIVMKHVGQTEGVGVRVKAANPMIEIVPRFPGCLVVPDRLTVDVRPESVEAQFFVTPLAPGAGGHARVEIWYEGVRIDTIDTPTKVTTQFIARVLALGGVLNPLIFGTLEGLGVSPADGASSAMLVQAARFFGGSYLMMGMAAAAACGAVASLFWMLNKPRQSDPVVRFMNWTGAAKPQS